MRVPVAKVWRAFPELDQFDDDRCRMYVAEAKSRRRTHGVAMFVVVGSAATFFLLLTGTLAGAVQNEIPNRPEFDTLANAVSFATAAVWLAVLTGAILMIRDRWLRAAIRDRLNTMTCGSCRYSLLGLTPMGASAVLHVVCPECGVRIELTPEMLKQLDQLGAGTTPAAPASP